jgi:addiction module RelE/StbE family toxin
VPDVIWSPQAIEDIESIRAFIARDSNRYADLVVESLVASVARLERFPESGRVVPEFSAPDLREVIWRGYRVVYRLRQSVVEIATVFHGSMQFKL